MGSEQWILKMARLQRRACVTMAAALLLLLLPSSASSQSRLLVAWMDTLEIFGPDVVIACDDEGNAFLALQDYSWDAMILKYLPDGERAWVGIYAGPTGGRDEPTDLACDDAGNAYVTGWTEGAGTESDILTIKYDVGGDTVWVRTYDGPAHDDDGALALCVDGQGNVVVAGPSTGADGKCDYVTIKYYPTGDTAWVRRYAGPMCNWMPWWSRDNVPCAVAADQLGNVVVTGYSPGGNGWNDCVTIKYSPDGETMWTRRYQSNGCQDDAPFAGSTDTEGTAQVSGSTVWTPDDEPFALAIDPDGNVLVTGASGGVCDMLTIKYTPDGNEAWVRTYDGPAGLWDIGMDISSDPDGNVIVAGTSMSSGAYQNCVLVKYCPDGRIDWVRRFDGEWLYALAVDGAGSAYLVGCEDRCLLPIHRQGFTRKYKADGGLAWSFVYAGTVTTFWEETADIAVSPQGDVFVAGPEFHDWWGTTVIMRLAQWGGNAVTGSVGPGTTSPGLLSPNPARAYCTIPACASAISRRIAIHDVSGRMVREVVRDDEMSEYRLSLAGIKPGVYFLTVEGLPPQKLVIVD